MTALKAFSTYDVADSALAAIRSYDLKPTPENYALFYEYCNKSHPDLVKTIDIILSNHRTIDDDTTQNLYKKFFTFEQEGAGFLSTAQRTDSVLAELKNYLLSYSTETDNYGQALANVSKNLSDDTSNQALKQIIDTISASTQKIQSQNALLHAQVQKSQNEIVTLKQNLDNLKIEASTDGLTGLANRKFFNATLLKNMSESLEHGETLSLLMIDIDHFKKFNDTHGHTTGDLVIRLVAKTLGTHSKGKGLPARYGGEEFAIIMPGTNQKDAAMLGEEIREAMASKLIQNKKTGEGLGQVTLSIGVTEFHPGETIINFIDRGDEALYAAKRAGRNRVCIANDV